MFKWRQENPEEFERTYHRRSLVESVFSSFKARFGAVVAAKTLPAPEAPADPEKCLLQSAVVVKLHAPDACPSPSARCAALPRSAPIPVPLQSECVKQRPNRRNRGRHDTARIASSRMAFAEMDNAAARQALFESDGRFPVSHRCDLALLFGGIRVKNILKQRFRTYSISLSIPLSLDRSSLIRSKFSF